mgnify:FL=1
MIVLLKLIKSRELEDYIEDSLYLFLVYSYTGGCTLVFMILLEMFILKKMPTSLLNSVMLK